ncbi:hypothetical protein SAMN05421810_102411 [Amycolatopsis arida]|uniref:Secreted protein n=1 Tax=Amycolatopsis arida TaxID=587909 RepID=A0A1I5PV76_9PSEU|nr:hypothetical protein [Amycolatopsis arida]TDX98618.1 hypothetical protein CLV69_101411 [Amycolatopsis arida]SFP37983.1 hypothetical protein SAMN05421810_102411 [Amycolatopsis arida]
MTSRRIRASRTAGVFPLLVGVTSALALTGAAFYTVEKAGCGDPGQYVRHDSHVELVGGCVDGAKLPHTDPREPSSAGPAGAGGAHNYRP